MTFSGSTQIADTITKGKSLALYMGIGAPVISAFEFFGVNADYFMVWAILMGIDLILWAGISFGNSTFSSSTMQFRLAKKGVFVLILATIASASFVNTWVTLMTDYFLVGFILSDIISILRHGYTILYKERLPEADVVKMMIKFAYKIVTGRVKDIAPESK